SFILFYNYSFNSFTQGSRLAISMLKNFKDNLLIVKDNLLIVKCNLMIVKKAKDNLLIVKL
ncbi:hypothetical protein EXN15_18975, partial [Clostridium botulinum]|nr:hypothetical protein [Clostridium botulinum]